MLCVIVRTASSRANPGSMLIYSVRLCLNLAIIAMVVPGEGSHSGPECGAADWDNSSTSANTSAKVVPDYGPRYEWSASVQGHVKAAYGVGYFIAHFPAGMLADAVGARAIVFAAILLQGMLTALVPLASSAHWGVVYVLRLVAGLGGGLVYPALHTLVAQWAPPNEKGKFIFSLMGGTFSAVGTWPVVGAIIDSLGWEAAFYYIALTCCAWSFAWLALVYDSPAVHPFISESERSYILTAQSGSVRSTKRPVRLRAVATSVPFIALLAAHYGNLWGLFLLTTDTPLFLSEVLGFSIKESGFLGSLPSLGRCVMSLLFGAVVDHVTSRGLWKNKSHMRKAFVFFSHIVPGALMLGLAFVGCNVPGAIALLTIGLSFNGASTVTNLVNHHDLAPNYAGSLYGFMNGFGATTLWIVPSVTGAILESHNGLQEWKTIYLIGSGLYLVAGVIFIAFGSAEIQEWNNSDEDSKVESEKKMESAPPHEDPVVTPDPIIASDAQVQEAK
ncbi:Putative inorganic phosphate cotransporter-like Protein [Gryllus bimaculatus]|nr:Putative inorganic phosphate cotransporter-like Protein [Gryllus bimaculatus]